MLGNDPFGSILDNTVAGKTIQGRKLSTRRFSRVKDLAQCHILFISNSESKRLAQILAKLKDRSILTVGETDGFALGTRGRNRRSRP